MTPYPLARNVEVIGAAAYRYYGGGETGKKIALRIEAWLEASPSDRALIRPAQQEEQRQKGKGCGWGDA